METLALATWSAALALLFYRAGRRNGYEAGISDAGRLMFGQGDI